MYTYKRTDFLTKDAVKIREQVFVDEQGFKNEFDEIDKRSVHIVFYEGNVPFAVCRYYKAENSGEYIAGRIAVIKEYRGGGAGRYVMEVIESNIKKDGGTTIFISAQTRVKGFYEKSGFKSEGVEYYDEYCPHIRMKKVIC